MVGWWEFPGIEEKGHCRLVIKCDRRHFVQ